MSTLKTTNLQNASAASPAIVLAADGSATAQLSSINGGPLAGSRNRIINGDMRIDQRNGGAATANTISGYTVDRWSVYQSVVGKLIAQRNAGGVTPPAGFTNYLGVTSQSAYSLLTTDQYLIQQPIEGCNCADLNWGTANAVPVTLSLWVRSSLTGTFGGALRNNAGNRSYPFTFSISSANTWEYKTVTVPGDTTGAWSTDNSAGIVISLNLGSGATYSGAAGAWTSTSYVQAPTGATSVVGTNGATFYITGVQLEPGTVATPFERRSIGQELALCQRYYQSFDFSGVFNGSNGRAIAATKYSSTDSVIANVPLCCPMRTAPTVSGGVTARFVNNVGGSGSTVNVATLSAMSTGPIVLSYTLNTLAASFGWLDNFGVVTASAEL